RRLDPTACRTADPHHKEAPVTSTGASSRSTGISSFPSTPNLIKGPFRADPFLCVGPQLNAHGLVLMHRPQRLHPLMLVPDHQARLPVVDPAVWRPVGDYAEPTHDLHPDSIQITLGAN